MAGYLHTLNALLPRVFIGQGPERQFGSFGEKNKYLAPTRN